TSNEGTNPQEAAIVASHLSAAGVAADPAPYAQTTQNRNQMAAQFPSTLVKPWNFAVSSPGSLRASQIGSQANAFAGNNYGAWTNPSYDRLYEEYAKELTSSKRNDELLQIVKILNDEMPALPIFYVPQVFAFRKGLTGPAPTAPLQAGNAWNIATWDL